MEDEFVLDMVDHAVMYAESGFSVIPLHERSKMPAIYWQDFQKKAATLENIRELWRKNPNYNIGLICGAVSNVAVVDCDGMIAVERFTARFPRLVNTYQVLSGSGQGRHFYYRISGDMPSKRYVGHSGNIEIYADLKYVAAPPSVHPSGKRYEGFGLLSQMIESDLADVFEWIAVLSAKKNGLSQSRSEPAELSSPPQALPTDRKTTRTERAAACFEQYLSDLRMAREGSQNIELYRAAQRCGNLVGAGLLPRTSAESGLWSVAHAIGYVSRDGERQAWHTIQSGLKFGEGHPEYATR